MKGATVPFGVTLSVAAMTGVAQAQTAFPKSGYYVGMGDSVAAGTYSIPHPVQPVFEQLDALLRGFDLSLRFLIAQVPVPPGSRVAVVDLYTPSLGRQGLVTIERRDGFPGPGAFDFDPHPTNLGHAFIAREFEKAWRALP